MDLANAAGASFRADANAALVALVGLSSGAAAPSTTFAYQFWADTTTGWLKQRDAANAAWIKRQPLGTGAAVDIASATTLDLTSNSANSDIIRVAGTTTTTAITLEDGQTRLLRAAAAWPITHSASLICPGSANYTCAAGDVILAIGEAGSVVRLMIWKADGTAVVAPGTANVQGAFKNLAASATGSSASVTVTYDEISLEDTSNAYVTARSGSLTINSAASGANGLDTGALAASTWYSVWVIRKADGTTAGLISLSATAPTMPSGYTFKARVGWIRTDGTGNKYPLSFKQSGRKVRYVVAGNVANIPQMATGTLGTYPSTYAAVATGNYVPSTASHIAVLLQSTANSVAGVAPNNSYGAINAMTNPPPLCFSTYPNGGMDMPLESSNVYACSSGAIYVNCYGWEDNL